MPHIAAHAVPAGKLYMQHCFISMVSQACGPSKLWPVYLSMTYSVLHAPFMGLVSAW